MHENCRVKLCLNSKTIDKNPVTFAQHEKYKTFLDTKGWEISQTFTIYITWFTSLSWHSCLMFFQEFASIIPFKEGLKILTKLREEGTLSGLALSFNI